MGRKSRNKHQESEESDNESEEEYEKPKRLWSVAIQDTNDVLIDIISEYRNYDCRFKYIGISEIHNYVDEMLYKTLKYQKFTQPSIKIDSIMRQFILDIINIMDLEYIPLICGEGEKTVMNKGENSEYIYEDLVDPDIGVINPIDNISKAIVFLNYRIINKMNEYY